MDSITQKIKKSGFRVTKTRLAVLQVLSKKPQSVRSLLQYFQKNNIVIDRVTIYRILKHFLSTGIVTQTQLMGKPASFELASQSHHHHIICEACGDLKDITLPENNLMSALSKKTGFKITNHIVEFSGICQHCQ